MCETHGETASIEIVMNDTGAELRTTACCSAFELRAHEAAAAALNDPR